jgi:hypothetical protein
MVWHACLKRDARDSAYTSLYKRFLGSPLTQQLLPTDDFGTEVALIRRRRANFLVFLGSPMAQQFLPTDDFGTEVALFRRSSALFFWFMSTQTFRNGKMSAALS